MNMQAPGMFAPLVRPSRILWRRHRRAILLLAVPALVLLVALQFWLQGGRYAATENAFVKADIAQIAGEVSGRIVEIGTHDHAKVGEGDPGFAVGTFW